MGRYETPDYEVLKSQENFELRKYDSFYMVEYDNENDPMINEGFNTLFNYISSDNNEKKKISMTVPVIEEAQTGKMKMAFVLPKEFWGKAPVPNNENLEIKEFEEGLYAVIKYAGRSNHKIEAQQEIFLNDWIESNNWKILSKFMLFFYNAPFTPGVFRRNEIMVRVEAQ